MTPEERTEYVLNCQRAKHMRAVAEAKARAALANQVADLTSTQFGFAVMFLMRGILCSGKPSPQQQDK